MVMCLLVEKRINSFGYKFTAQSSTLVYSGVILGLTSKKIPFPVRSLFSSHGTGSSLKQLAISG